MINVTKSYLPDRKKLDAYIDQVYSTAWLTNNGPLLKRLEARLREYLGVRNIVLVANGSLALQVAYKAMQLKGEVITTPFSFAATTSTLAWEGLIPKFADINIGTFNLDPGRIEDLITDKTSAVLPVHVFGNPCDVEAIGEIAHRNNLKVVYDAAHAFGVEYKGTSVFKYGDVSTVSFHATKIFQTIEGGAIITEDDDIADRIRLLINFGITGPDKIEGLGTNAKMNEFEAAMGLCVLDDIEQIYAARAAIYHQYCESLGNQLPMQELQASSRYNYSYVPVLFPTERKLIDAQRALIAREITPRRYFYPSLDTLPYLNASGICPVSRDVSSRILCLPTYFGIREEEITDICRIVLEHV